MKHAALAVGLWPQRFIDFYELVSRVSGTEYVRVCVCACVVGKLVPGGKEVLNGVPSSTYRGPLEGIISSGFNFSFFVSRMIHGR